MNVYISASFPRRLEALACARELKRTGISVCSQWHVEHDVPKESDLSHGAKAKEALADIGDLECADLLMIMGDPPGCYEGNGGKFVEFGYALNAGIPVVIVGFRESVFGYLPGIVFAPDWEAAKAYVAGLHVDSSGRVAA